MKRTFAIPTHAGLSCEHFGHCQAFAVVEVVDGAPGPVRFLEPPVHQPGSYPRYLADQGVDVVLAGGMGGMAQNLFRENGIEVHLGVGVAEPGALVSTFLAGDLAAGTNACNHGESGHEPRCAD